MTPLLWIALIAFIVFIVVAGIGLFAVSEDDSVGTLAIFLWTLRILGFVTMIGVVTQVAIWATGGIAAVFR